ncbi:MAG: NnrU family protein [Pseudomonadota bacterium]
MRKTFAMTQFFTALLMFFAAHIVPALPDIRPRLVAAVGAQRYLIGYSVVSLSLLVWVGVTAVSAPAVVLWHANPWLYYAPIIAMLVSFMLIGAGLAEPNPLSISLSRREVVFQRPGAAAVMRHPVLWGFGIWSASHIPPNGVLVSTLLFAIMTLFAIAGGGRIDKKRKRSLGDDAWAALEQQRRSALAAEGLKAFLTARTLWGTAFGLAAYVVFLFLGHRILFGVDPSVWVLS